MKTDTESRANIKVHIYIYIVRRTIVLCLSVGSYLGIEKRPHPYCYPLWATSTWSCAYDCM